MWCEKWNGVYIYLFWVTTKHGLWTGLDSGLDYGLGYNIAQNWCLLASG